MAATAQMLETRMTLKQALKLSKQNVALLEAELVVAREKTAKAQDEMVLKRSISESMSGATPVGRRSTDFSMRPRP